jgi:chitodextrinase
MKSRFLPLANALSHLFTRRSRPFNLAGAAPLALALAVVNLFSPATLQAGKPMPPAAPSGLVASAASTSQINLTWRDNSGNESGFLIQRAPSSTGTWTQIASVGANVMSYSNTGLAMGTAYYYRVCAYNSRGNSAYSAVASANTVAIAPSCTYSISSASASFTASGGNSSVGVTTTTGCAWSATSSATAWLTCSPASGTGSGTVTYSVAANTTTSVRTGTLTIAGQTFTVTQAAAADATPPVATLSSPTSGATLTGTATFTASASDNMGVARVEFWCDGSVLLGTVTTAPYNLTYNTAGLPNGTRTFACKAYDTANNSTMSAAVSATVNNVTPDTTAPSVPSGVTATAVSSSQINLSWVAATDTGGSGLSGYKVYLNGNQVGATATTGYSATGLSASTTYSYTVAAYDGVGNTSAQSTVASATTPAAPDTTAPSVPAGVTASAVSSSQINLSWSAATDTGGSGLSGYKIFRNGSQIGTTATTAYSSTGLSASTTYSYTVAAYDGVGNTSAQSTAASATTPAAADTTAPSVPPGVTASAVSSSQINLSWSAATDTGGSGLSGYKIFRNGVDIGTTTTTSYSNTGLAASAGYCYAVAAYDNAGNTSAQSAQPCATTQAAPDTTAPSVPAGLNAAAASTSQITLSWSASTDTGGSGLAGYKVYLNGVQIGTTTATTYSSTGLSASTTYSYTVAAYDNSANTSAQSAAASATTSAAPDTTAPSVPAGLTATAASSSQINLTWSAATDTGGSGLAGYKVFRSGTQIATTTTTSYSNTGLAASTTYSYTVAAYDGAGNTSPQSASASATTQAAADTVPPTVTLMSPTSGATLTGSTTLSASASDNVSVSRVEFYCDGTLLMGTATTAPYNLSYNTTSLPDGSRSFTCKAYDAAGNSTASAAVSATVSNSTVAPGPWVRRFGNTGGEVGQTVAVDGTGNIVVAGYFQGSVDFGGGALTSAGGFDLVIAKCSAAGSPIWSKRIGGTGDEFVKKITVDASGNILVVGNFRGATDFGGGAMTSAGGLDMFIAKYSATGQLQWAKQFGSIYDDSANSVAVDGSGNVFVTGYFSDNVDFGGGTIYAAYGGLDAFVVKFSPTGGHLWSKNFVTFAADYGNSVAVDGNGDVVVGGYFLGTQIDCGGGWLYSHGGSDAFVVKYSSAGAHVWSKCFGGSTVDQVNSVAVDSTGNVLVLGVFTGSVDFGGGALTDSGGYDAFLAKLSPTGSHLWSKAIKSGGTYDWPNAVATDANGNVVVSGNFRFGIDFSGGVLSAVINGVQCFYVAKYSPSGSYVWAERFGGTSSEDGIGIATDSTGHVVSTGFFQGTGDFGGQSLTAAGSTDMYLLRLDP